ncbi:cullin-4A [Aphelenchoides avenae]|nr:cullin-4A [Aphelenchus avenae]
MSENRTSSKSNGKASRKRLLNTVVSNTSNGEHEFKKPKNPYMEVDKVDGVNGSFDVDTKNSAVRDTNGITMLRAKTPNGHWQGGTPITSMSITPTSSKKLSVKNFRPRSSGSESNTDAQWCVLEDAILKIQKKKKTDVSLEELYKMVEGLCETNHALQMYAGIKALVRQYITKKAQDMLEKTREVGELFFLQSLNALWLEYCNQMIMVRSVFIFMDRTYVLHNAAMYSLWDAGLEIFRSVVMDEGKTRQRALNGLLNVIHAERMGSHVDRQLIKSLLRMFGNLRIYEPVFESAFLKATTELYKNESRAKCQELDVGSYLRHVDKRLSEEDERLDYYLDFSTRKKLISITEECFIANYVDTLVQKGADVLLNARKKPELQLLYSLVARTKTGVESLRRNFGEYIKKVGKMMVLDAERDKTLVQDLLDFKSSLSSIVDECFRGNAKFAQTQKDAFDYFINTRPNKPAELIAKFMDFKLRCGNKECSDEELDNVMDSVMLLFRFIQGKDVFEAFYKKDLAKRLLLGRSASVDAEKAMLSKLKHECGAGFTQKLEGMFKDMELSKELCSTFKQYLDGGDRDRASHLHRTEFSVNILTMGHWPNYAIMEVNVPAQLCEFQQVFAKFYASKHNGRKLQWQYSLASAILKGSFKPKVHKELDVSLFQAMVLLMFNDRPEWFFDEIKECTKIDEQELKRTMQSLACGKYRVIIKEPRGKDVSIMDKFAFNEDFNDRHYRLRISQVQMRETEAEHRQTEEQIFQDRQYQIDAAVVRIMKMRKTLAHNLLISELYNQLRFPVKPVDLKKRIESLIEREYMCRDKDDSQVYHYVS